MSNDNLFGEVIYSYTRRQAIEDGVLVEVSGELAAMARQIGFKWPFAITSTAYHRYVDLTDAARAAGNDINGRWWDVLTMLHLAAKRSPGVAVLVVFEFYCVVDKPRAELCRLKAVVGPDDDGKPCFTIMLPEED